MIKSGRSLMPIQFSRDMLREKYDLNDIFTYDIKFSKIRLVWLED